MFVASTDKSYLFAFENGFAIDKNSSSSFRFFLSKFSKKQNLERFHSLRSLLTFADSAYKFYGFHLHLRIRLAFCGIHLQLRSPEQLALFACCGIRNTTFVPTKFTLQVFVRWVHGSFVKRIRLHFVSLESRNLHTQNCGPIQCTVWSPSVLQFIQFHREMKKMLIKQLYSTKNCSC